MPDITQEVSVLLHPRDAKCAALQAGSVAEIKMLQC